MNDDKKFKSLSERIKFVQHDVDLLAKTSNRSFADKVFFRSMDSHLSELREQKRYEESRHPLLDFMEIRLKGTIVDLGTIPLEVLGVISTNLASMMQKATYKMSSGNDSRRVPYDIKSSLNMRLAELSPGSTKLGLTFSTGQCELIETVSSQAVKGILSLLGSKDANSMMNQVAEIGYNSAQSLKRIIEECEKNGIIFDISWIGPFSNGRQSISVSADKIKLLGERLATTKRSSPVTMHIVGELATLSKYGKLELEVDGEKIKAAFPIDMLDDIQKTHKVGQKMSLTVEVTDISNDNLGLYRKNYLVKSIN
jgi:hypothetical protein